MKNTYFTQIFLFFFISILCNPKKIRDIKLWRNSKRRMPNCRNKISGNTLLYFTSSYDKPKYSPVANMFIFMMIQCSLPPRFCACSFDSVLSAIIGFSCSTDDDDNDGELFFIFAEWLSVIEIYIQYSYKQANRCND